MVYGLKDPRNDVYRYIGKTTVGASRPLKHLVKSHNNLVNEWVDELKTIGMHPIIDVIEKDISLDCLSEKERYYIGYYSSIYPLFNNPDKRSYRSRAIKEPSLLLFSDLDVLDIALSRPGEIYKMFKAVTGFKADTISDVLNVGRKTVYRISQDETSVMLETVYKIVFFLKHGLTAVFDYYYSRSSEFLGDYPDTYGDFISRCSNDSAFCRKWFTEFYKTHYESNI